MDRDNTSTISFKFILFDIVMLYHKRCSFESRSRLCVLDTTLCDKVFSDLRQVFGFPGVLRCPPLITIDCHHIAKILLKEELNTITLTPMS